MDRGILIHYLDKIQETISDILVAHLDLNNDVESHIYDELDAISDTISNIADEVATGKINSKLECRIRFVDDCGVDEDEEGYAFEVKRTDEDEWNLDTLFKLIPQNGNPNDDLISYQALTKIRELQNMGVVVRFGK